MHRFHPYAAASARFRNLSTPFSLRKKIPWWYQILDPGSERVTQWNHIFFIICILGLFLDPLYFFLPSIGDDDVCMEIDIGLSISVTFLRTVADFFYIMHILIKFRIAFVDPGSRVFGRGQLVKDPWAIALRYLKADFSIDLAASLPLPQVPKLTKLKSMSSKSLTNLIERLTYMSHVLCGLSKVNLILTP